MRPNTSSSGIFSTNRSSAVSVSMLTRMLVPKPKNAFQSPFVHRAGLNVVAVAMTSPFVPSKRDAFRARWAPAPTPPAIPSNPETQPKIPPCALIIFRPISWNSGK